MALPGAPRRFTLAAGDILGERIRTRYDIVGVDPRGIGGTHNCVTSGCGSEPLTRTPGGPAEVVKPEEPFPYPQRKHGHSWRTTTTPGAGSALRKWTTIVERAKHCPHRTATRLPVVNYGHGTVGISCVDKAYQAYLLRASCPRAPARLTPHSSPSPAPAPASDQDQDQDQDPGSAPRPRPRLRRPNGHSATSGGPPREPQPPPCPGGRPQAQSTGTPSPEGVTAKTCG
ncbi:hypothetical protein Aglo01_00050 [Actinokineospora globicatena]|nr:hypothetical protein Aglo01_00050 [Actinokineospora globicatena]GLW82364.1 hypothetical protein Aglo02_00050 [Actinokineospora globicatena]